MAKFNFTLNGSRTQVDVDPSTPLLWVLRDHLGLTGTKFGCGVAQCGACTVHVNDEAVRSCAYMIDAVAGALAGQKILREPFDPTGRGDDFVRVAFVEVEGAVVEFMQYGDPDEEGWF